MGLPAKKLSFDSKSKSTRDIIEKSYTQELIFGICAPIGTRKKIVIDTIKERLEKYDYKCHEIKLSELIDRWQPSKIIEKEIDEEIETKWKTKKYVDQIRLIKKGDKFREYKKPGVLIELAIQRINLERTEAAGYDITKDYTSVDIDFRRFKGRRVCYIIDSLKNVEELKLLRTIYRDLFYFFSIFSPETVRKSNLTEDKNLSNPEAQDLIEVDRGKEKELSNEDEKHGQNVGKIFQQADFFFRLDEGTNEQDIQIKITRYLHLIFNTKIITPFPEETAMYHAKSAAGNSACLSRQIGASITDENNEVIAVGWNDVPKYGGGLYNSKDKDDYRCFNRDTDCFSVSNNRGCINDYKKDELAKDLVQLLIKSNLINKIDEQKALKIIPKSKIKVITEYSRAVHAEMHAIISGAQLGSSRMKRGTLYTTTYPCHNCAKHIVVAGIKEVFYIEPYPKSLSIELHDDSICEHPPTEEDELKVVIRAFDGIAPNRYMEFFSMKPKSRKFSTDGMLKTCEELKEAEPKTQLSLQALPALEHQAIYVLDRKNITLRDE